MKWIVKRDFYRTKELKKVKIVGAIDGVDTTAPHPDHIHMGSYIELGDVQTESELATKQDDQSTLIAKLRVSGCIGNAADTDVVKRVTENVALEKKRLASIEAANKRSDATSVIEALAAMLKQAKPAK